MKQSFNRVEKKYLLNKIQYDNIKSYLDDCLDHQNENLTFHEFYTISNIYYDTDDNLLIKKSVSKPKFKQKLRLRAYGKVNQDSVIFIELKKKLNGYVNKRRTRIALDEVDELVEFNKLPSHKDYHNEQILREIQFFTTQYKLKPALYLYYEREVYSTQDENDLRITFDKNITTRRYDLDITKGNNGEYLLGDNYFLLEVKTNSNMPIWLNKLLNESQVFPTRFSKYGTEFFEYLKTENEVNSKCINPYLEFLK